MDCTTIHWYLKWSSQQIPPPFSLCHNTRSCAGPPSTPIPTSTFCGLSHWSWSSGVEKLVVPRDEPFCVLVLALFTGLKFWTYCCPCPLSSAGPS